MDPWFPLIKVSATIEILCQNSVVFNATTSQPFSLVPSTEGLLPYRQCKCKLDGLW